MTAFAVTNISGSPLTIGTNVWPSNNYTLQMTTIDQNTLNAYVNGKLSISPDPRVALSSAAILQQNAIPFISLSTGSIAANGALTGITALPQIYPDAFCWFPANAVATVSAAGWYYCTFSSTTVGVVFLNQPNLSAPAIPATLVPVTDGKGAYVGDTTEEFGPSIPLIAGALGVNGILRLFERYTMTNNAGVKTGRTRMSGNAGTVMFSDVLTSLATAAFTGIIANRGKANSQMSQAMNTLNGVLTADILAAVDTTAAATVVLSLQKATATDNLILDSYLAELMPKIS